MAIDERRRMFRLSRWQATPYTLNPKTGAKGRPQDIKEVWFAGDHADIGGGHPEIEAGLSKLSLRWMAGEAHAAGLRVNKSMLTRVTTRKLDSKGRVIYCAEDPLAQAHAQPKGFWKLLEYIPKDAGLREWSARRKLFGKYLPAGEPRPIEPGAFIHESVARRMATGYAPVNLGKAADIYIIAANEAVGGRPRK